MVSYETFINDVAARVASLVKEDRAYPDYISQRKAYRLFGRGNVDRWAQCREAHHLQATGQGRVPHIRAANVTAHRVGLLTTTNYKRL